MLGISFSLQLAKFKPLLHHEPEELINWANLYGDTISPCVLVNGCRRVAELEKLRRLLHSSDLDLKILVVGDETPEDVLQLINGDPILSHCSRAELVSELKKCELKDSDNSEDFCLNLHNC